jgi:hypothetical protein
MSPVSCKTPATSVELERKQVYLKELLNSRKKLVSFGNCFLMIRLRN